MIGYIVGPVLALALGMKFTVYTKEQTLKEMSERIEALESNVEQKSAQSMLMTMTPLIKRVKDISTTIGI